MSGPDSTAERFRRWHMPWKERVCDDVRPRPYGLVLRSSQHPDFWEYNCIRLDEPLDAETMIAAADRELADCSHRLVEWTVPMPDGVVADLRARGWMATPLLYLIHDGRSLPGAAADIVEAEYDAARELRNLWHVEDFGIPETPAFHAQAREVAELADVRVLVALEGGEPAGFAQVEAHDGGSEVGQVFVRRERRGAGLGGALTSAAIGIAARLAADVWICAERDGRPRALYERLGFRAVAECGSAIRPPRP